MENLFNTKCVSVEKALNTIRQSIRNKNLQKDKQKLKEKLKRAEEDVKRLSIIVKQMNSVQRKEYEGRVRYYGRVIKLLSVELNKQNEGQHNKSNNYNEQC